MEQLRIKPTPMVRIAIIAGSLAMLTIWGITRIPAIPGWNDPLEDGFSFVSAAWASISFFPLGLSALLGGVGGGEKAIARARLHLMSGGLLLVLVLLLALFRRGDLLID
jgi:hypothetical protein